jgi:hypothetical protein
VKGTRTTQIEMTTFHVSDRQRLQHIYVPLEPCHTTSVAAAGCWEQTPKTTPKFLVPGHERIAPVFIPPTWRAMQTTTSYVETVPLWLGRKTID